LQPHAALVARFTTAALSWETSSQNFTGEITLFKKSRYSVLIAELLFPHDSR
jgi:hypothetical protein